MKIFVTGGSGFLGRRLLERLVQEHPPESIGALVRSESAKRQLSDLPLQFVEGSMNDISSWEHRLEGVDHVLHLAGPVEFGGEWEFFRRNIVQATEELLHAADRRGVKRFVYISSESVLQDKAPLLDVTEQHPYPQEPNSFYGKGKMLAEQAILSYDTDMTCLILRPTFIYEPGCRNLQDLAQMVRDKKFVWLDHGRTIIESVHVQNVVEAICLACENGRHRGIYWVTDGRARSAREMLTPLLEREGVKMPGTSLPGKLAFVMASFMERLWRSLGKTAKPPLTRFEVSFLAMPRRYDLAKSRLELGYQPRVYDPSGS